MGPCARDILSVVWDDKQRQVRLLAFAGPDLAAVLAGCNSHSRPLSLQGLVVPKSSASYQQELRRLATVGTAEAADEMGTPLG